MARGNGGAASSSRNGPGEDTIALVEVIKEILEAHQQHMALQQQQIVMQQQQIHAHQQKMEEQQEQQQHQTVLQEEHAALIREGLLTVQKATTAAVEKEVAPREQRAGNITDFKRLNPKKFSGNEKPLVAKQ